MRFAGKTVVVTGSGRGIGRSIALAFARHGARLAITFLDDEIAANSTAKEIEELGTSALVRKIDIRSRCDLDAAAESIYHSFGSIDVLVNNAAINFRESFVDMSETAIDEVIDTNLKGTLRACSAFTPYLRQSSGCIVNVSSSAAVCPFPRSFPYVAAKSGLTGLTRALALELAPSVRVNAVAPGIIEPQVSNLRDSSHPVSDLIPLKRLGTGDDVADAVIFLANQSGYITGQTILVDGGLCFACPGS